MDSSYRTPAAFGDHLGRGWIEASLEEMLAAGVVTGYRQTGRGWWTVDTPAGNLSLGYGELVAFLAGVAAAQLRPGTTVSGVR